MHFRSITPHFDYGISAILPFFGALTSTPQTPTLQAPLDDCAWRYAIDNGAGTVRMDALDSDHSFVFNLDPMHHRQGEGESCGTAVETAMDSTVVLDVIHDYATPWPRIETDAFIMTTGSARPMEDAFRIAHTEMVHWIAELTGMSTSDSYQFVSQASLTPVANAVDTNYTVVCKIAKCHLKGASVYGGIHDQLKALEGTQSPPPPSS